MKPRYRFVERLAGPPGHDGVYVFEMTNRDQILKTPWDTPYDRELRYVDRFWAVS